MQLYQMRGFFGLSVFSATWIGSLLQWLLFEKSERLMLIKNSWYSYVRHHKHFLGGGFFWHLTKCNSLKRHRVDVDTGLVVSISDSSHALF